MKDKRDIRTRAKRERKNHSAVGDIIAICGKYVV